MAETYSSKWASKQQLVQLYCYICLQIVTCSVFIKKQIFVSHVHIR